MSIMLQFTATSCTRRKVKWTYAEATYRNKTCPLIVMDTTFRSLDSRCELLKKEEDTMAETPAAASCKVFQRRL